MKHTKLGTETKQSNEWNEALEQNQQQQKSFRFMLSFIGLTWFVQFFFSFFPFAFVAHAILSRRALLVFSFALSIFVIFLILDLNETTTNDSWVMTIDEVETKTPKENEF